MICVTAMMHGDGDEVYLTFKFRLVLAIGDCLTMRQNSRKSRKIRAIFHSKQVKSRVFWRFFGQKTVFLECF